MKVIGIARAVVATTVLGLAACGSDSTTGPADATARIRIVNSAFQFTDAASTASKAVPRAVDMLIDSVAGPPSALAIAPGTVVGGSDSSQFLRVSVAAHGFFARLAGQSAVTAALYTNATNLPYIPRQYLPAEIPFTIVVAGIAPVTAPAGTAQQLMPATAFPFVALPGDLFAPPQSGGVYQARFRLINAAPFAAASGTGATVSLYLTPGPTPPASLTGLTKLGDALYRNASAYFNQPAGPYVATVAVGTTILAQVPVTLGAGEVRTFVLVSTAAAAAPGVGNHRLTSLLDAQF